MYVAGPRVVRARIARYTYTYVATDPGGANSGAILEIKHVDSP